MTAQRHGADFLAEWAAQLDDVYGPIRTPDGVTIEPEALAFGGAAHRPRLRLMLTATRWETRRRKPPEQVTRVERLVEGYGAGFRYLTGTERFDTAQDAVDALAGWAAEGDAELFGGTA